MFLIPEPKVMKYYDKEFFIKKDTEIVLAYDCDFSNFDSAKLIQKEIFSTTKLNIKINKSLKKIEKSIFLGKQNGESEGYTINIDENGIEVMGNDDVGLFYGVQTLCQIIRQNGLVLPGIYISDAPYFKHRGFYHDVTRGKVPTLETLKELVDRLSFYKINELQLYIEHSFAFKNFSEIWIDKDPLTAEEILELDAYCKKRNVELIPSLATFGHLYEVLSTKTYCDLCELDDSYGRPYSLYERMAHHTLDVTNNDSIEFVKAMLEEFIPLFSSDKFNICCDETFDIGKGRSSEAAKTLGVEKLYVDFLKKIINHVKTYDKTIMFWGDIILKKPEYLKELPEDVICLNWAYYPQVTEKDTKILAEAGVKQYVCPGVGGWNRIMNSMDSAFININKMISYGKEYGALGVLNTDWGDYGHVNLFGNSMPGMIYGAALSWNPEDKSDYDKIDKAISTLEFGENSKNLVGLLRQLANAEIAGWTYLVWFMEYATTMNKCLNDYFKGLNNLKDEDFITGYYKALELEREILEEGVRAYSDRCVDVEEFTNSAKGVALMNALCLILKKYELGHEEIIPVLDKNKLSIELEYWFMDYSDIWRKRNKESELYRIRDIVMFMCSYLRNLQA